jgi:hypothetical protein
MRRYVNMAKSGRMAAPRRPILLTTRPVARGTAPRPGTGKRGAAPASVTGPRRNRRG